MGVKTVGLTDVVTGQCPFDERKNAMMQGVAKRTIPIVKNDS
jgi:hypothetical protein